MFGRAFALPGVTRRFLGRQRRLLTICECIQQEDTALHPLQIARRTGFPITDVTRCLDEAPELFVRMPVRRGGYTRYRVVSALMHAPLEEVQAEIHRHARGERFTAWLSGGVVFGVVVIVLLMMLPWTSLSGRHVEEVEPPPGLELDTVRPDPTLAPRGGVPYAAPTAPESKPERYIDDA